MSYSSTVTCPECHSAIPKLIENVKIMGCPKCGSVAAMSDDGYLRAAKKYTIQSLDFQEPFSLGEEIQYDGLSYTIFGIYVYFVEYEEWDEDDDKWVHSQGYVTEWYAKSATDEQLIVMKDTDNVFYIVSQINDNSFVDWQNEQNWIEFGTYKLNSLVGVDNEALEANGFYRTYPNNIFFESNKKDFTEKDFKTFRLKSVTPSDLRPIKIVSEAEKEKAVEDFEHTKFYRNVFGIALVLILGLMLWGTPRNHTPIGESKKANFAYRTFNNEELDTMALRTQSVGVFDLKAGTNYRFFADGNISSTNSNADFSISIVRKEDQTTVSEVDIAFYTESGLDDEGSWTEDYLHDDFKFQVDKSGKYEIFASPDYDDLTNIPYCSLTVFIQQAGYYYYYLMAGGVFLLVFLIFQWQLENIAAFANLPYETYLHDLTGR